jgi:hypothetical protein
VGMGIVRHIKEFAQLFARRGNLNLVNCISGLTRGHVMCARSDTTDARNDARKLLDRTALAKALKPPQLGDLKVGVLHLALVVQKNLNLPMSLQAGDGIYGHS